MKDLIQERILLKQLVKVNPNYESLFKPRIQEIKTIINSDYEYRSMFNHSFTLFSLELNQNVTNLAIEHLKKLKYMKKFKKSEIFLLTLVLILIGVSEYYFIIQNQPLKAIFIGLWCPTILCLMLIFNQKKENGKF